MNESRYRSPEDRKGGPFEDYEVREALSTLTKAEKIKRNRALMRAVLAEAEKQLKTARANKSHLTGGK